MWHLIKEESREAVERGWWQESRGGRSALRPAPCPLPWRVLPLHVRAGECPADGLPCWSTAQQGKPPVPRAEELACRWGGKVPVPQHRCLLPAQLPLAARASDQELGPPLLSPALGEAVLGPAPSPEQPWPLGSIMPTTHGTPTASAPGKRDPGVEQGALAGPSPAQTNRAPPSPICSGWTSVTS